MDQYIEKKQTDKIKIVSRPSEDTFIVRVTRFDPDSGEPIQADIPCSLSAKKDAQATHAEELRQLNALIPDVEVMSIEDQHDKED